MMVERMARAMFPHFWAANMEDPRGPEVLEQYREDARDKARAALHAMREPTIRMQIAAVHAMRVDDLDPTEKEVLLGYLAMIDAALKDEA